MFLFSCCKQANSGHCYELSAPSGNNKRQYSFVDSFESIPKETLNDQSVSITQIKQSDYQEIIKRLAGKKFEDQSFPANQNSLGLDVKGDWKRISHIIDHPKLFAGEIRPRDVIRTNRGGCYFVSTLGALAENGQAIKEIFRGQEFNPKGIYKVMLRIAGDVEEVIVDDYIPVNEEGQPLFCQPNKNEFWMLILEKAWAKANGSYANIINGTPTQLFRALTFAPSELIAVYNNNEENQKLWTKLQQQTANHYPCCCVTSSDLTLDWHSVALTPGSPYTLMGVATLEDTDKTVHRLVKLRNLKESESAIDSTQLENRLFGRLLLTKAKKMFIAKENGIVFVTYQDFCKYFVNIYLCYRVEEHKYFTEKLFGNGKNGSIVELQVTKSGEYFVQVHQQKSKRESLQNEELSRITILAMQQHIDDYELVDGTLKYKEPVGILPLALKLGKYVLYIKLESSNNSKLPNESLLSIYSNYFGSLRLSNKQTHPKLLQKVFLHQGRLNKRAKYNNNLMWVSWKLYFQNGGFAYIALGNDKESKMKFVVTFDQDEFVMNNFRLKKDYKGKGNRQVLQVLPGQQKIILARVANQIIANLKFPPSVGIRVEPV